MRPRWPYNRITTFCFAVLAAVTCSRASAGAFTEVWEWLFLDAEEADSRVAPKVFASASRALPSVKREGWQLAEESVIKQNLLLAQISKDLRLPPDMASDTDELGPLTSPAHVDRQIGKHTDIYVVAPTDTDTFNRVFSNRFNAAYQSDLGELQHELAGQAHVHFATNDAGSDDFKAFLSRSGSRVISVIGHNEHGIFKFLQGDAVPLSDLAKACAERRKLCVFLSCDASTAFRQFRIDYAIGVDSPLNYREAARAAKSLDGYMLTHSHLSLDSLLEQLPEVVSDALSDTQMKGKLLLVAQATGATAATGAVVVTLQSKASAASNSAHRK